MEKKYISIDQLWKCETCFYMGSDGKCRSDCDAVESYRPAYSKFEFADVAPVVHGKWCWEGKFKACSECGSYVEWDETLGANFWKFCPFCGAMMELPDIRAGNTADRCVCCGDVIPEGRQVCPACEGGTNART